MLSPKCIAILGLLTAVGVAEDNIQEKSAIQSFGLEGYNFGDHTFGSYSSGGHGFESHNFGSHNSGGHSLGYSDQGSHQAFYPPRVITKTIKIPFSYPVHVERKVPVSVQVPVDKPYPVHVVKPYPVHVEKQIPFKVDRIVPYPVKVPYNVPVVQKVEVPVDKPYPVRVQRPYPVKVDKPYIVEKQVPVYIKISDHYDVHNSQGQEHREYNHSPQSGYTLNHLSNDFGEIDLSHKNHGFDYSTGEKQENIYNFCSTAHGVSSHDHGVPFPDAWANAVTSYGSPEYQAHEVTYRNSGPELTEAVSRQHFGFDSKPIYVPE